eukprot:1857308-Karenia_brevis.AAC.1
MACRSIRCYQFHPGVIAGCTPSTTFAKILVHAILQEAYDTKISEAFARRFQCSYATTLRTFVDDISSISRGFELWVLKAQRNTSTIVLLGAQKA